MGEEACFVVHLRGKQERKRDDEVRMMEELEVLWKERLYDLDTHVIILRGNGERGFCAGLRLTKEAINMNLDAGGLEQALNMEDRNQTLLIARGMLGKGEKVSKYF